MRFLTIDGPGIVKDKDFCPNCVVLLDEDEGYTDIFTDGQTGFFCHDNGPDMFATGACTPRGRETGPGGHLLLATDTPSPCLRCFHTPENTHLPPSCPVN